METSTGPTSSCRCPIRSRPRLEVAQARDSSCYRSYACLVENQQGVQNYCFEGLHQKGFTRLNREADRIPALYYNEKFDTLWLTNYNTTRAVDDETNFWHTSGPSLPSIAIPFETYSDMVRSTWGLDDFEVVQDEETYEVLRAWFNKKVANVTLIVPGDELRIIKQAYDPRLVRPRSALYLNDLNNPDNKWLEYFDLDRRRTLGNNINASIERHNYTISKAIMKSMDSACTRDFKSMLELFATPDGFDLDESKCHMFKTVQFGFGIR